ncbi:hypothetical protein DRN67_00545 [Candidatus Micrarchaeota archaeon]|nr:MAG: hypothetical protein DRN67_00545 [Candidatus Micrarchaeota archaeon]
MKDILLVIQNTLVIILLIFTLLLLYGALTELRESGKQVEVPELPSEEGEEVPEAEPPEEEEETETCEEGWLCKDELTLAYQLENCSLVDETTCEFGCENASCNPDPCAGVVCEDYCDGNTRMYNGRCIDGQCEYSAIDCMHGCEFGLCVGDACEGITCQDYCDGNILYYNGACAEGNCKYSSTICPYGCSNAQCEDLVCDIEFEKYTVCIGEWVVGHVYGAPLDTCDLYYRTDGGDWKRDPTTPTFVLDENGHYAESRAGGGEALFDFRAICGECITDLGTINVINCSTPEPMSCYDQCKELGYYGGYDGQCGKPWLYEGETQVDDCCCYMDEIPEGYQCYDTDGQDIYTKGTCYDASNPNGITDSCVPGMEQYVNENWCGQGGWCTGASMACPSTHYCVDGKCVQYDGGGNGGGETDCDEIAAQYGYEDWSLNGESPNYCYEFAYNNCYERQMTLGGYQVVDICCMWVCVEV